MSLHSDLLCQGGCGFYGNANWNGFCSRCWREHQRKHGSPSKSAKFLSTNTGSTPTSPSGGQQAGASLAPKESKSSKILSPKKSLLAAKESSSGRRLDKNIKQLFGARMTSKESPEKSPKFRHGGRSGSTAASNKSKPELPKEAREASNEFAVFLKKRLERQGVSDVSKQVNEMVEKILKFPLSSPEHIDDLSVLVQDNYQIFQRRLETAQFYKNLTDDDRDRIIDLTEKYITVRCFKLLFSPNVTLDEDKDLELQNRIRNLNWISTEHLNASIDEFSQEVRDLLYQAINDLLEMDGQMAPQDKMASLVKCCKNIFEMLKLSNESPASADDFLPCLIYVCLKANPPRIQSNINFITRFCNENKLRMGEGGYFFANLCCAMSFIDTLKAESVNMDPDEFESYTSGKKVPLESWRSNLLMCDGLQKMSQNLKLLADLKTQQENILSGARQLELDMEKFDKEIELEVNNVLERTSYVIKKPTNIQDIKELVNLDADLEHLEDLPAPLLPESLDEKQKSNFQDQSFGANQTTLEDYLSVSDNMSLLSLDMSGQNMSDQSGEQDSMIFYRGFSAQSSSIPSISCNSAAKPMASSKNSSNSSMGQAISSTSSSSPMISVPTSPDENSTPKKSSSSEEEDSSHEPTAAKVLSGIFETFDNLL